MEKLIIKGSTSLKGEVTISGAKNAAVAILPAALLINGKCTIENLPNISDVKISCEILSKLGAKIEWLDRNTITIDATDVCQHKAPVDMTSKFRASYYLIGSLLSRCKDVEVGLPGGCIFKSPIKKSLEKSKIFILSSMILFLCTGIAFSVSIFV